MFEKFIEFVGRNKDLSPDFEIIPLTEKQNSFQYVGGQIENGMLYSIVNSAEKMLKYDIENGTMYFGGTFSKTDFKWTGGCVYERKLYSFPRLANSLLVYDPDSHVFEEIDGGLSYDGEHHYGGVCTPDGMIYQPPRSTDHILKWDIKNKTCKKIQINNGKVCRYCGSVIHPNGNIYFIPEKDFCVIKMNMKTEEISYIDSPVCDKAFNPAIAANGNIYGFCSGNGILKIDTKTDKVKILYEDCKIGSYGTKGGINGKLYSLPGYTNDVWEFDPFNETLKKCYSVDAQNQVNYAGGAIDLNGDIYALPVHADNIFKISFKKYNINIPLDIYNTIFKDCY